MTVASNTPYDQYSATSGQTVFNYTFEIVDETDLLVYQRGDTDDPDDSTQLLTLTTDYTVTGVGNQNGGTIVLVSGATVDDVITIVQNVPVERDSSFTPGGVLRAQDLNTEFDNQTLIEQRAYFDINNRMLKYNYSSELNGDVDTVLPKLGASQIWRKNSGDTAIEAIDFDDATGGAPSDSQYWLSTPDGGLPNGVDLGALASGLLKHSVSGGVSTPARAVPATDYWAPGNDLTTPNPPSSGNDVTNKTYVDALVSGGIWFHSVRVASTSNFASTYDNGTSGIGATLAASSNGAASIDGVSLSLNDRVLFKDQSSAFENGLYKVTQVGDGSNPAIYTRTDDFNEPDEIDPGDIIPVREGTVNNDTFWVQTSTVNTIGSDSIDFSLFGNNPNDVVTITGAQTITGAKTFNANVAIGNGATLDLNSTTAVDGVIDDDTMATASATTAATSESIKAYVDTQIGSGTQVVQYAFSSSTTNDSTTSTTMVNSSLSVSITPTDAANKILVFVFAPMSVDTGGGSTSVRYMQAEIYNSTDASVVTQARFGRYLVANSSNASPSSPSATLMGIQNAPSTLAQTYRLRFSTPGGAGITAQIDASTTKVAFIIAIELKV